MGAYAGPELADDGLVLALDAANTRSYGGSGTTWTDITYRGNNGTLTNGPAYTTVGFNEPFGGAGGVYFDGTGDYLSVADNASLQLGSGDFTIEFWIYLNSLSGNPTPIDKAYTGSGVSGVGYLLQYSSSALKFYGGITLTSSTTDTTSVWIHYALVRNSGTTTLYRNGVSVASGSDNTNYTYNTSLGIGANVLAGAGFGAGAGAINGYLSNLRIVKGTALYTSNFTPPRSLLTAVSGTSLLTCQKGSIRDASSNNFAITVNGNSRSVYGFPAFKFDATDDYVQVPSTSNVQFGAENFTIECWINSSSLSSQYYAIVGQRTGDTLSTIGWSLYIDTSKVGINFSNGSSSLINTNNTTLSIGTWYHVAAVRNGSNLIVYVNGVGSTATSVSGSVVLTGSVLTIGGGFGSSIIGVYNGYISNTRIYKGKALTASEVLQNYQNTKSRYGL